MGGGEGSQIRINPVNAGAQFVLGELARQDSKTDEAITHFTRATELDAMFVDAWLGLGRSLLEAGKPAEAVQPLERAVKLQPRTSDRSLPARDRVSAGREGRRGEPRIQVA